MKRQSPLLLILATLLLSVSCAATVPLAPPTAAAAAKASSLAPEKSRIYIVRQRGHFGKAILFQVALDGKLLGGSAAGTYFVVDVDPGDHSITALSNENQALEKVVTAPGRSYYIKVNPQGGMMTARVALEVLSDERGRELVEGSALAQGLQ